MKITPRIIGLVSFLGASSALCAENADRIVLIDQKFESPTNVTVSYPPAEGESWQNIAPDLSGSARKGSTLELTYGEHYGFDRSGGIFARVKTPITEFMQLNFSNLKLPMLKDGVALDAPLRSIEVELDADIPEGKSLQLTLQMNLPKNFAAGFEAWKHPVVLGTLKGAGSYQHYKFTGADIKDETVLAFTKYIHDLYSNGLTESKADLVIILNKTEWEAGAEFFLDNVRLSISSK